MPRPKPTRRVHWATYLWPGLAHLWIKGSLAGLALALAFSVLLNILVLGTLVWPAWLETRLRFVCAAGALLLWVAALWETRCELQRIATARHEEEKKRAESAEAGASAEELEPLEENHPNDERLAEAQKHYLRGNWVEAEQVLRKAIRTDRRDVEVCLWYVMLLRRTGRLKQAKRRLDRLELFDAAEPWRFEIREERRLLSQLAQPESLSQEESSTVETKAAPEAQLGNQGIEIEEILLEEVSTLASTPTEEPKTVIEQDVREEPFSLKETDNQVKLAEFELVELESRLAESETIRLAKETLSDSLDESFDLGVREKRSLEDGLRDEEIDREDNSSDRQDIRDKAA